jgi:hypothetical protein
MADRELPGTWTIPPLQGLDNLLDDLPRATRTSSRLPWAIFCRAFSPVATRWVGDRRSVHAGFQRVPSAKMVVWV